MAVTAVLGFKEGCTILSYDGANSFNSIYHHRFLPALAEIVPSVVPDALDLYVGELPNLVEDLAAFTTLVVSSGVLSQVFRALHTSANLSALGQKSRPVACGDVLKSYWHRYLPPIRQEAFRLLPALWPVRRSSLRQSRDNGVHSNTLCFKECCTILSYDGANAFNSIYRHRFLPALAEIVPSVVPCVRDHPSLFISLSLSLSFSLSLSLSLSL